MKIKTEFDLGQHVWIVYDAGFLHEPNDEHYYYNPSAGWKTGGPVEIKELHLHWSNLPFMGRSESYSGWLVGKERTWMGVGATGLVWFGDTRDGFIFADKDHALRDCTKRNKLQEAGEKYEYDPVDHMSRYDLVRLFERT